MVCTDFQNPSAYTTPHAGLCRLHVSLFIPMITPLNWKVCQEYQGHIISTVYHVFPSFPALHRFTRHWPVSGSFSFSVLSGKVMFRDLAYITTDGTARVQDGFFIFRWWRVYVPREASGACGGTRGMRLASTGLLGSGLGSGVIGVEARVDRFVWSNGIVCCWGGR